MSEGPRPYLLRPGEGSSVWSLGGRFTTKVGHGDSGGRFALVEVVASRGAEPPLHIHHREDEAWYVLEGQLTFHVGDEVLTADEGSFAFAPMGIPHAFTVDVEPTRVLLLAAPAGFERFAADLGVPAGDDAAPPDLVVPGPDILNPIADRYGIEIVGPPIRVASGEVPA
jgi:quercetin dioxygenase-like cupin family protein